MNILWYNWKDTRHPGAGGAENYTYEIARRLVTKGHSVTLFVSEFDGCRKEECVDGISIIRDGGKYSVYPKAKSFYKQKGKEFDVVVDEINTRPFLTPKFVGDSKIVALIHQLAREFWFYETPLPVALVGYFFFEKRWLRNYIHVPTITVSESTRKDLDTIGFEKVFLVPNGLNVKPVSEVPEKTEKPTIIYVGRMKKAKRPQDVIKAFRIVKQQVPDAQLWMVGDGYLRKRLEGRAKDVKFFGYVDNKTRDDLIKRSWVLAVPGVREGWGQVVTDSNALGTPGVGYNIPGLRDSIKDEYSGLLVDNNPNSLASGLIRTLRDNALRETLSKKALQRALQFSWERSANEFAEVIES